MSASFRRLAWSWRKKEGTEEEPSLEELVRTEWLADLVGTSDLPSGAPAEVAALLRRTLVAEGGHAAKAAARLQHQAEWRVRFGVPTEGEVPNEIAAGKVLVQPPPCCSAFEGIGADGIGSWQGKKVQAGHEQQERQPSQLQTQTPAEAELCLSQLRPLVVVTVSKHLPGESLDELERFVVLVLDTASQYAAVSPDGQLAALFDLRDVTMRNLQLAAVRLVFATLERHFPERLHAIYLLDASRVFHAAWHLIKPFIDAHSRKKVRFLDGSKGRAAVLQDMGPDVVPAEFGGRAVAVPIELAVCRLPAWQKAQRQTPAVVRAAASGAPPTRAAAHRSKSSGASSASSRVDRSSNGRV